MSSKNVSFVIVCTSRNELIYPFQFHGTVRVYPDFFQVSSDLNFNRFTVHVQILFFLISFKKSTCNLFLISSLQISVKLVHPFTLCRNFISLASILVTSLSFLTKFLLSHKTLFTYVSIHTFIIYHAARYLVSLSRLHITDGDQL